MSLRTRVLLFVLAVSVSFAGTAYLVQHAIVLPEFAQVELRAAARDLDRCSHALERDAEFLSATAGDYAAWDDTYAYTETRSESYEAANLIPETFENLKLDLLLITRPDGTLLWGNRLDAGGGALVAAPELMEAIARPHHPLVSHAQPASRIGGVLATPLGLMLVGSAAITTSDRRGAVRGAVIMGRLLGEEVIAELAERTRVAVQLFARDAIPAVDRDALPRLTEAGATWSDASLPDHLRSYALVLDVFGAPVALLRAERPRDVMQHAAQAATLATAITIASGAATLWVMWLVLARSFLRPLSRLTAHTLRVGATDDLRSRLAMTGSGEIAVLAREFDRTVGLLAESRAELLDVASRAGRAQVAADVLHNVGNVLNSVTVSVDVMRELIGRSEAPTLQLVVQLLQDHRGELALFLRDDPRGQKVPDFLAALAVQLSAENTELQQELKSLGASLEHIQHIVRAQQEHTGARPLIEWVEPAMLVEQALGLHGSLERNGILVERWIGSTAAVPFDRHRVLQILANLLSNAVHAVRAAERSDPQIRVEVERCGAGPDERLCIRVRDNGVGIASADLSRIFAAGYSTRADGQGIGLHSAANLAQEMGGSLEAHSDGAGQGAVFTLTLPLATENGTV